MQERQDKLLTTKTQISQLIENSNLNPDLFVISIGSAHLSDKQQQCPSFCHEAVTKGQHVVVINFDNAFSNNENMLCGNDNPNLRIHYSTLAYNNLEYDNLKGGNSKEKGNLNDPTKEDDDLIKTPEGYSPVELRDLVIKLLTFKPNAKIVLVYNMFTLMPNFYKHLVLDNDFIPLYKDRLFFIGSYYKDCSGFVYNQEYIAKHGLYERAADAKQFFKAREIQSLGYSNFDPNEKLKPLEKKFSSDWNMLMKYEGEGKEGCIGKTVKKDYGIDKYSEIAPKTDATLGYRFISLQYLALDTVLQSHFNPQFLAQQRTREIAHYEMTHSNTAELPITDVREHHSASFSHSKRDKDKQNASYLLVEELNAYMDNKNTPQTIKKSLSDLLISIDALPESQEKQNILRTTYDLLISKSVSPEEYVTILSTCFVKATKEGNCTHLMETHQPLNAVFDLAQEENKQRASTIAKEEIPDSTTIRETQELNSPSPVTNEESLNSYEVAQAVHELIQEAVANPSGFMDEVHDFDHPILSHWSKIRTTAIKNKLFTPSDASNVTKEYQEGLWSKIKEKVDKTSSEKKEAITTVLKERYVECKPLDLAYDAYKDVRSIPREQGPLPETPINVLEFWLTILDYVSKAERLNYPVSRVEQIIEGVYNEHNEFVSHDGFIAKVFAETGMAAFYKTFEAPAVLEKGAHVEEKKPTIETPLMGYNIPPLTYEGAMATFNTEYNKKFNEDKRGFFGWFRTSRLKSDGLTLAEIFDHALNNKGCRTRSVLTTLKWLDKQGHIEPELQDLMNQQGAIKNNNNNM
ncbi:MAG: hypothetical protein Q8M40_11725 [Legionella sp.]|nr:hypothetical protein [Legionella sp.]